MLGQHSDGVEPRVHVAGDLLPQHVRFRFTDLGDALGFALAGEDALLGFGLGGDDGLLGVLPCTLEIRIRLVAGDFDLHLRAGQLGLHPGLSRAHRPTRGAGRRR